MREPSHPPNPVPLDSARLGLLRLLLFLMALGCQRLSAAFAPTNWVSVSPAILRAQATSLQGFRDEVLVVTTEFGAFYTSLDGELWSKTNVPPSFLDGSVLPGLDDRDGVIYGLGGTDRLMVSTNGLTWSQQPAKGAARWNAIAHGNGILAAGSADDFYTASSLTNWTRRFYGGYPGCVGLIFFQDHFVLLSPNLGAWLSTDTDHWQRHPIDPRTPPAQEASGWTMLRSLNGLCFALGFRQDAEKHGSFAISQDGGLSWSLQVLPTGSHGLTDVAYANGRYVMVGRGVVGHSDDGQHWAFDYGLTPERLVGVAHVKGRFVTVDSNGATYVSADGIHWRSPTFGGVALRAVTATGSGFVAVGDRGKILTSTNGRDWVPEISGTQENLLGVWNGDGLTIATGDQGIILTSTDTHAWTLRHANSDTNIPTYSLYGVAHARGRYVTAGAYLSSTDGLNWQPAPGYEKSPGNQTQGIIDDGTQFVFAVTNRIGRSVDGLTWTLEEITPATDDEGNTYSGANRLAFGNGRYVGVGPDSLGVSTNALGGYRVVPLPLSQIKFLDGAFLGLTDFGSGVAYSTDGVQWDFSHSIQPGRPSDIAYKDGVYVLVDTSGHLFCCLEQGGQRLTQPQLGPSYGFHLGFAGVLGHRYRVQYSTDLQTWNDLTTLIVTMTTTQRVLDSGATTNSFRWYRAIEE